MALVVTEIAPGIDLQRDVLDQAEIPLRVSPDLRVMHAALFRPEPFGLQLKPRRCAVAEQFVQLPRDGQIATVTLARPQKLNSLTPAMLDELERCARELEADTEVRVVVVTGEGEKAFCVGADINEWAALQPLDMWRRWVRRGHQVFDQWARLRQPVIAAINGHAFGGGLELALTADIRISAPHASFALPEASIATCPGWSGTQRLVQLVGASRAKYLALERAPPCGPASTGQRARARDRRGGVCPQSGERTCKGDRVAGTRVRAAHQATDQRRCG